MGLCIVVVFAQSARIDNGIGGSVLGYIISGLLPLLWSHNSFLSLLDILLIWLLYDNILQILFNI